MEGKDKPAKSSSFTSFISNLGMKVEAMMEFMAEFVFALSQTILFFIFDVVLQLIGFIMTTVIAYGFISVIFVRLIMLSGLLNLLPCSNDKEKMETFPVVFEIECGLVVMAFMISEDILDFHGSTMEWLHKNLLSQRIRVVNSFAQLLVYGTICIFCFPVLLYKIFDIQLSSSSSLILDQNVGFFYVSNPLGKLLAMIFGPQAQHSPPFTLCGLNLLQLSTSIFLSLALPTSMIAQLYLKFKDWKLDAINSFILIESYWLPKSWRSAKSIEEIGFKQVFRFYQGFMQELMEFVFWRFIWNLIIGLVLSFQLWMNGIEVLALGFLGWNFALASNYGKKKVLKMKMKKNQFWLSGKIGLHLVALCLNMVGLLVIISSNIIENGRRCKSYPIFSVQDYVDFSKIITFIVYSATTILIIAKWSGKTGKQNDKQEQETKKGGFKVYIIENRIGIELSDYMPIEKFSKEHQEGEKCKQDDGDDSMEV